jgi:ferredoxin
VRVAVDTHLCEANGVCVGMAPDVFDLTDDDELVILVDDIDPQRRQELSEVVASCPRSALTLHDTPPA